MINYSSFIYLTRYILFFNFLNFFIFTNIFADITLNTAWGEQQIKNPLIEKLIRSKTLERLKEIDQSGPIAYFGLAPRFSRYEHSIGVFVLLYQAYVPIEEQIAGLFHDVSHTAFSHIGDHLFYKNNAEKSYQDTIHLQFLKNQKVDRLLSQYGIDLEKLDPDLPDYQALERPHPYLCADRIQYIIHTAVIFNKISKKNAKLIIDDLRFKGNKWFFTRTDLAKKFAMVSLDFTKELWGSPWNYTFYEYFSIILRQALNLKNITINDIKYGTDQVLLNKLLTSEDPLIKKGLNNLKNISKIFKIVAFKEGEYNVQPKFRGVDPLVLTNGIYKKLSELDKDYKAEFYKIKKWCQKGYGVNILDEYKLKEKNDHNSI